MKLIYLISTTVAIFFSVNIGAQVAKTVPQKTAPAPTMASVSDSLKKSANAFTSIFKSHTDTTTITITEIDYEDSNLTILKENIKKLKGVRSLSEQYKSNIATLKVSFKGKSTVLWDDLSPKSKAPFKLVEASDNSISLKFKNDKTVN
ncbi:MAG TPA: hypothetical protein VIJ95_05420 [Hanamia sp.]